MKLPPNNTSPQFREFIKAAALFCGLYFGSVILHETSHVLAAAVAGISPEALSFGWFGVGPGLILPYGVTEGALTFIRFAGGVGAGLVYLLIYLGMVRFGDKGWTKKSWGTGKWWLLLGLLCWGLFQVWNGYVEGAYSDIYRAGLISAIWPFILFFLMALCLQAVLVRLISRHLPREIMVDKKSER